MIEITDGQWRLLMWLAAGVLVLLFTMFAYVVKTAREAYLGHRWIQAAGSYERAARELRRFDCETDAILIQHAGQLRAGQTVTRDRVHIEKALGLEAPERVGTLVLDDGRRFPWHDGMRVTTKGGPLIGGVPPETFSGFDRAKPGDNRTTILCAAIRICDACGHAIQLHVGADPEAIHAGLSCCTAQGCSCPDFRKSPL